MINRKQAQKRILAFAKKYEGKEIFADTLNSKDLYNLVLADTYLTVDALLGYDADVNHILDRAIENAEKQKQDNYKTYIADNKEPITIL